MSCQAGCLLGQHQGSSLQRELAPREAASLQNKGEEDLVGQFWSGWLGADEC